MLGLSMDAPHPQLRTRDDVSLLQQRERGLGSLACGNFGSPRVVSNHVDRKRRQQARVDDVSWLMAREIPHLRRYATALLGDAHAADDLVQDTLERALRKRRLFRRGHVRGWLFRILYRLFLNQESARKRRAPMLAAHRLEQREALADAPRQEARVAVRDVSQALERLPAPQRATILLIALEGLSYDQAAEVLEVPVGTVRSRLSRGREALREMGAGVVSARRESLWRVK